MKTCIDEALRTRKDGRGSTRRIFLACSACMLSRLPRHKEHMKALRTVHNLDVKTTTRDFTENLHGNPPAHRQSEATAPGWRALDARVAEWGAAFRGTRWTASELHCEDPVASIDPPAAW